MHAVGRHFAVAILLFAVPSPASADLVANRGQTIALPDTLGGSVNVLAGVIASDDCDDIRVTSFPQRGTLPAVSLRTGPNMWRKRVEVYSDGRLRGTLDAPGNEGRSGAPVPLVPGELYKTQLHLVKPKALGVMTGFYQIVGLSRFGGQDIEIFWARDRC